MFDSQGGKESFDLGLLEKTKTTKPDIQKALAESYAYCDRLQHVDAREAAESVDFFGVPNTRLLLHAFAVAHNFEHYGNLVTYMRLKKIVPPSTEQQQQRQQQQQPSGPTAWGLSGSGRGDDRKRRWRPAPRTHGATCLACPILFVSGAENTRWASPEPIEHTHWSPESRIVECGAPST